MLRIEVGPDDLARSRFAVSALAELENVLRGLRHRTRAAGRPDLERLRPTYDALREDLAVRALLALQTEGYGPDFVVPPPQGMAQTVEDDLRVVRATPLAQARREIERSLAMRPPHEPAVARLLRGRDVVSRLADALERSWHALVGPDWPVIRAILERDVVHRATQLSREGWAAALDGLHDRLRWHDGAVEVLGRAQEVVRLDGRGLLLVPAAHLWPRLMTYVDPPWPTAIVYPARGVAALWQSGPPVAPGVLARLVGGARAEVLHALDAPASTSQLVHLLALPLGTVGGHLAVLRDAGLVTGERAGRSVLYRRTPVGDALVGTAGSRTAR